jgi:hypothetical protein
MHHLERPSAARLTALCPASARCNRVGVTSQQAGIQKTFPRARRGSWVIVVVLRSNLRFASQPHPGSRDGAAATPKRGHEPGERHSVRA